MSVDEPVGLEPWNAAWPVPSAAELDGLRAYLRAVPVERDEFAQASGRPPQYLIDLLARARRFEVFERVTQVVRPALVPELQLRQSADVVAAWRAAEECEGAQQPAPFWAYVWAGGQALARWVLDHPDQVRGKRVLDFACGSGVSTVACARAGATALTAVDIDPFAVVATRVNGALEGAALDVQQRDLIGTDEGWELVLVGDVFYEPKTSERVVAWATALSARGALVLVGDPRRKYLPTRGLEELARYTLPVDPEWEGVSERTPCVWRLRPTAS